MTRHLRDEPFHAINCTAAETKLTTTKRKYTHKKLHTLAYTSREKHIITYIIGCYGNYLVTKLSTLFIQGSHSNDGNKFQEFFETFQHYKSQKIYYYLQSANSYTTAKKTTECYIKW